MAGANYTDASPTTSYARDLYADGQMVFTAYNGILVANGVLPLTTTTALNDGGLQIVLTSGTLLTVNPYEGGTLYVNGSPYQLSAPITISNGGLVASTVYYLYVFINGTTPTLELSTTGYTVDATGRKNKTGDITRRLIGMVHTSAGAQFDFVLNYFNRKNKVIAFSGSGSTASTLPTQINGSVYFLSWADDAILLTAAGNSSNNTASGTTTCVLSIDAAQVGGSNSFVNTNANWTSPNSLSYAGYVTEGTFHNATFLGAAPGGSVTFNISCYLTYKG